MGHAFCVFGVGQTEAALGSRAAPLWALIPSNARDTGSGWRDADPRCEQEPRSLALLGMTIP
jgi:hypothetical protein